MPTLSGSDLQGANPARALNLSGANLQGANLRGAVGVTGKANLFGRQPLADSKRRNLLREVESLCGNSR